MNTYKVNGNIVYWQTLQSAKRNAAQLDAESNYKEFWLPVYEDGKGYFIENVATAKVVA